MALNLNLDDPPQLRDCLLRSSHDWQTPPASLTLIRQTESRGWLTGRIDMREIDESCEWVPQQAVINPLLEDVHQALETFRGQHSDDLNAIDPADLKRKLDHFTPSYAWSGSAEPESKEHRDHWLTVRDSREWRDLALAGHELFKATLHAADGARALIADLPPGSMLKVRWTLKDPGWIANIPWGLMCVREPKPGKPVEPTDFLGFRNRIEYVSYPSSDSIALGRTSERGYLYYFRGPEGDEALEESVRQHDLWSGGPNYHAIVVPGAAAAVDAMSRIALGLTTPSPSPMRLLYIFCECSFPSAGKAPQLVFGNSGDDPDSHRIANLPGDELKDRPLVFLNACRSGGGFGSLAANRLEYKFFERKCRAYLGTVARVPIRLAARFAEAFFHFYLHRYDGVPTPAGEAVVQARLFLLNRYGNVGGLFYNYVNRYNCYAADENEDVLRKLRLLP